MKKTLALLMAVLMVVGCFAGATAAESETYTGLDWDAIAEMDHDEASDVIYEYNLGEFYSVYAEAKSELDTNLRAAKMAIAEAKLMESGVFIAGQTSGGNYSMSRIVARTYSSVLWGLDNSRYHKALVTEEIITAEDRTALITLWKEAADESEWLESAKAFLDENGYTLRDSFDYLTTDEITNWDILATSYASDGEIIAPTVASLLEYDTKNQQQPALATSYEVSEDGLTYTFHIREGVKWVDQQGREVGEVTANDWVTAMMHVADTTDELGYLLSADGGCGIKNYDAYINGECDFSEVGVKAIDDYTLEYTLEAPFPAFLTMMSYSCFSPLNYDFYKAQGGTFGAEGDEYTAGNYGTSPSTIAYCGAYLITNYTALNVYSYTANPSYWDAENVQCQTMNYYYADGTDTLRQYNDFVAGTIVNGALNTSSVEQARIDKPEGSDETYFDLYVYVSDTTQYTYPGWINLDRSVWTNANDESKGVSDQTDEEKYRAKVALNNQNFRLALAFSFDRASCFAVSLGEDVKYNRIRNSLTPGTFLQLTEDTTVEINGVETTFPAGTYYGQIEQAQLEADGYNVQVWSDELESGDGFDGWYNPEEAVAYLDAAIEELAQVGVEISAENPICLDVPYQAFNETATNRIQVYVQTINEVFEGKIVINLIGFDDQTSFNAAYYRINGGDEANYDILPFGSGWGPDYGDASSYLDIIIPYGYMSKCIGLY